MKLYMPTLIILLCYSYSTQEPQKLIGSWQEKSYKIDNNITKLNYLSILTFNEDNSYIEECTEPGYSNLHICSSGNWNLKSDSALFLNRDNKGGTILHPMELKIYKFKNDTLAFKGKEGTKDILIYYIKLK